MAWPKTLVHHLDGLADVELVDHVSRDVLHTQTVRFGAGDRRVSVVDAEGNPLAVDKGGRLQRDFSNTEDSARDEIMDALEQVLRDLTDDVRTRRLPDVRLPARRDPRRSHDRARLGRRRRLPQQVRPPLRHHPRVHRRHPHDAGARLEGRADVRRELQGVGAAARRPALRHRRVRLVPHRRAVLRHRLADRDPGPVGAAAVRHRHARGPRDRRAGPTRRRCSPSPTARRGGCPTRPSTSTTTRSTYAGWTRGSARPGAGCASGATSTRAPTPPGCRPGRRCSPRWVQQRLEERRRRRRPGARRRRRHRPRRDVLRRAGPPGRPRWTTPRSGCGRTQRRRARSAASTVASGPSTSRTSARCWSPAPGSPTGPARREIYARGLLDTLGRQPAATTSGGSPRWCSAAAARRSWSSAPRGRAGEREALRRAPAHVPRPGRRRARGRGARRRASCTRETGRDLAPLGRRTRRSVDSS